MGRTIYQTTKILVGGTEIKVRQPAGEADSTVPGKIAKMVPFVRHWLHAAIPQITTDAYVEKVAPVFRFCFHCDPEPAKLNVVRSVLMQIDAGLQRPFSVKVRDLPGLHGRVNVYFTGPVCAHGGTNLYFLDDPEDDSDDGRLIHRLGEIHMDRKTLSLSQTGAITLIHEAGHRFANLDDFDDRGYFRRDRRNYRDNRLPWQLCLRNADSYAMYVALIGQPALQGKYVPGVRRAEARTAQNDVDDALDGLSRLFS